MKLVSENHRKNGVYEASMKTMEDMHKMANDKNGKCLSTVYNGIKEDLKWECKDGHTWETTPHTIRQGAWCPTCAGKKSYTLQDMCKLAESYGGKCLSTEYKTLSDSLNWECKDGHKFSKPPHNILHHNTWCSDCTGLRKYTMDEIQKIAIDHGGRLVSTEYKNCVVPLLWECDKKHQWLTPLNSIANQGTWCPYCSKYKSEDFCRQVLEQLTGKKFIKIRHKWFTNSRGNAMELDGYCEELKMAFEYQGKQHYELVEWFSHDEKKLEQRKIDDIQKVELCKQYGIELIVIPYWVKDLSGFIKNKVATKSIK